MQWEKPDSAERGLVGKVTSLEVFGGGSRRGWSPKPVFACLATSPSSLTALWKLQPSIEPGPPQCRVCVVSVYSTFRQFTHTVFYLCLSPATRT